MRGSACKARVDIWILLQQRNDDGNHDENGSGDGKGSCDGAISCDGDGSCGEMPGCTCLAGGVQLPQFSVEFQSSRYEGVHIVLLALPWHQQA